MSDFHFRMEEELVIKLCKGETITAQELHGASQYQMLGLLCMHRCAGMAYDTLLRNAQLSMLNREMRTSLQAVYESNIRKGRSMHKALRYLSELFRAVSFPYAFLKGAKLIEIYPEGTRNSNDIDILIERESIPAIAGLLSENGFSQGYIRNNQFQRATRKEIVNALINRGETTPFVKQVDWEEMKYLEIDVNISIDESGCRTSNVVKQMLSHAVPQIHAGTECLYTLDVVDFFIHLCVHLYKEASVYQWVEMGKDLSLYKFLDICIFWKQCMKPEYLPILERRIKTYYTETAVYYALTYANVIWGMEDTELSKLIQNLDNSSRDVMNTVYDPAEKKKYIYTDCLENRIFDEKRKEHLTVL